VEKYLKSILAGINQTIPKTHDLGYILDLFIPRYPVLKDLSEICNRLTPFGIVTRYPGSSMTVSKSHMDFLLSSVEKVKWAITELVDNL
jgi:HEPN domain-containing protein